MKKKLDIFINHRITSLVLALLILFSILFLLLEFSESFPPSVIDFFETIGQVLTTVFIVELSIRYYVAKNKTLFFRRYWLDIIAVIPFARPLRAFRMLRLLRLFRIGSLLSRSLDAFRLIFSDGRNETLVIAMTIIVMVLLTGFGIHLAESESHSFDEIGESIWWSLMSLIAGEPIGATPASGIGKVLAVIVMLGGLTVFAMFTGLVSAVMVKRMRSEMEVKAMEISELSDHILICGWNRRGLMLLHEFSKTPEMKDLPVVLIGQFEDTEIFNDLGTFRSQVYMVGGDPTRIDNLKKAGADRAKYAILLADKLVQRSDQDRDARTILTALTLEKMSPNIYTVAELLSRQGIDHLKLAGVEEVIVGDEISSHIIASSIRNRGLLTVLQELLTTSFGCQFYKIDVPKKLIGMTFEQAFQKMKQSQDALVLSIERMAEKGLANYTNPPLDMVLEKGDRLVVVAKNGNCH